MAWAQAGAATIRYSRAILPGEVTCQSRRASSNDSALRALRVIR